LKEGSFQQMRLSRSFSLFITNHTFNAIWHSISRLICSNFKRYSTSTDHQPKRRKYVNKTNQQEKTRSFVDLPRLKNKKMHLKV